MLPKSKPGGKVAPHPGSSEPLLEEKSARYRPPAMTWLVFVRLGHWPPLTVHVLHDEMPYHVIKLKLCLAGLAHVVVQVRKTNKVGGLLETCYLFGVAGAINGFQSGVRTK